MKYATILIALFITIFSIQTTDCAEKRIGIITYVNCICCAHNCMCCINPCSDYANPDHVKMWQEVYKQASTVYANEPKKHFFFYKACMWLQKLNTIERNRLQIIHNAESIDQIFCACCKDQCYCCQNPNQESPKLHIDFWFSFYSAQYAASIPNPWSEYATYWLNEYARHFPNNAPSL